MASQARSRQHLSAFSGIEKKYLKFDLLSIVGIFGVTAIFSFIFQQIYPLFFAIKQAFLENVIFWIPPENDAILLLSLFGGMILSVPLLLKFTQYLLQSDWEEYIAYSNRRYGFDYLRALRFVLLSLIVLLGIGNLLVLDAYSAFGEKTITINPFLSLGETEYSYTEVQTLKEVQVIAAPNGDLRLDPHFIIEFSDGTTWSSRYNGLGDHEDDREIMELVVEKTQLELQQLEIDL